MGYPNVLSRAESKVVSGIWPNNRLRSVWLRGPVSPDLSGGAEGQEETTAELRLTGSVKRNGVQRETVFSRSQEASCSSSVCPLATERIRLTTASSADSIRRSLRPWKTYIAWNATRLFPSRKGGLLAMPNPYEAASPERSESFSYQYRFGGRSRADSRSPRSRNPPDLPCFEI